MTDALKPCISVLVETFIYDAKTGILRWRIKPNKPTPAGAVIGNKDSNGRLRFTWNNKAHSVSKVAFAIHYGRWPKNEIDHINRVRDDNRITNLREATRQQNSFNRKGFSSCGYKGVSFSKGLYQARITIDRKTTHIGSFDSALDAAKKYNSYAKQLFGEFAYLNKV